MVNDCHWTTGCKSKQASVTCRLFTRLVESQAPICCSHYSLSPSTNAIFTTRRWTAPSPILPWLCAEKEVQVFNFDIISGEEGVVMLMIDRKMNWSPNSNKSNNAAWFLYILYLIHRSTAYKNWGRSSVWKEFSSMCRTKHFHLCETVLSAET